MTASGAYGSTLATSFHIDEAPFMVSKTIQGAEIAITSVKVDRCSPLPTAAIPYDDAFLVCVPLREIPVHELWLDGRSIRQPALPVGSSMLLDLRRRPVARCLTPIHNLFFYIPRRLLGAVVDQARPERIEDLHYSPYECLTDAAIYALANAVIPVLEAPDQLNYLYFEHVTLALCTHIARVYGGVKKPRLLTGLLAPWQERRAKEMIAANLAGKVSRGQLAAECGLSAAYFANAFKRSVGISPHQWLLRARVELTKKLLSNPRLTLAEVAVEAGFHDQSHMTRIFSRFEATTPAIWRRDVALRPLGFGPIVIRR